MRTQLVSAVAALGFFGEVFNDLFCQFDSA
jgi:hypothetical protein